MYNAGAPPNYHEVEEKRDQAMVQQPPQKPTQQPPPIGQVYYPAQQSQVVPGTVYQTPYQIPQMHQQVNSACNQQETSLYILTFDFNNI